MGRRSKNSGISSLKNICVYWILVQYLAIPGCQAINRRHSHQHQHQQHHSQPNSVVSRKEISLTRKTHQQQHHHHRGTSSSHHQWNGENRTSCSFISNYDDLPDLKCTNNSSTSSRSDKGTGIDKNVRETLSSIVTEGLWSSSCGVQACSIIYMVKNGSTLKQGFISGFVDRKGEILVQAEYFVDKRTLYQLAKLHTHYDDDSEQSSGSLTRKQFEFFHEDDLDISILNVTILANHGFAVIDSIKLITEDEQPATQSMMTTQVNNPANDVVSLDKQGDSEKDEWIDITCNYSESFEDFWTFGCPVHVKGHKNSNSGFWFPCHRKTCSFLYDGTLLNQPRSVTISGFKQGSNGAIIELSGKGHTFDDNPLRILDSKSFHNSTVFQEITFDLTHFCNISVLQILVSSEIIIDTVSVHLHKDSFRKTSCKEMLIEEEGPIENARAMDIHDKSLNSGPTLLPWSVYIIGFIGVGAPFYTL